ncbi:MAG: efflux RND transporter periplasmic adaptor subunit [Myxococcales bacterium]|nr:efflux RND transporter periplasmic adaptor subunit [Myxococcales bacterium]
MSRGGKAFSLVLLVGALGGLAFFGPRALDLGKAPAAPRASDVPTARIQPEFFARVAEARGYLAPVDSTPITTPRAHRGARVIAWMLPDGTAVEAGDVLMRFDDTNERLQVASNEDEQTKAEQALEKERVAAEAKRAERDLSAEVTKEELTRTRELGVKDERFFPRTEVIESQIDEALYASRLAHAAAAKTLEQRVSKRQLEVLAVDRKKAIERARETQRALDSLEVRAEHAGLFVVEPLVRQGDRVWGGMRIAQLSSNKLMEAEVYVLEADAGGLAPTKPAEVIIESQPGKVWKGEVKSVEPFPKPLHADLPTQYFTARISLLAQPTGLGPGQSVRARIFLERREGALVVPRQALFERDGHFVVFVRRGGRFVPTQVSPGPGTIGRVVIEQGLTAGDEVALRDPERDPEAPAGPQGGRSGAEGTAISSGAQAAGPPRGARRPRP